MVSVPSRNRIAGASGPEVLDVDVLFDACRSADDPQARRRLQSQVVLLNLDLADALAHRYSGRGVEVDDLVQVARLGLVKAVRRYEPGRGRGFASFAAPTILGEIKRYFRDHTWAVRPPRPVQELTQRILGEEESLRQDLAHEPSPGELADRLGVTERQVGDARAAASSYRTLSLDVAVSAGHLEPADPRDPFERLERHDALHRALATMSARERTILRLRFVEERTQEEIGMTVGLSQMQVSRLLNGMLRRLHHELTSTEGGASARRQLIRANNTAMPCPPPTAIAATPSSGPS